MKRREFLKTSIKAGLATGILYTYPGYKTLVASTPKPASLFDLVAIKGGEPADMFKRAIQSLGGMKKFVKPNQSVVIKPNIGWDASPERAANTNPHLVEEVILQCMEAGAKDVYVFDHTCDEWTYCYKNSGIEKAVRDAGGKMVPGNSKNYYQVVDIKGGKKLKSAFVHELILETDVFINIPVLKHHGSARVTVSMKNLMGVVWDRGYWHRNNLHQCIADYASYERKPDLNIIDAYRIMKKNGPRGVSVNDTIQTKSMILSADMLAADVAATKLFGQNTEEIPYLQLAHEHGVGVMDLTKLKIDRISL